MKVLCVYRRSHVLWSPANSAVPELECKESCGAGGKKHDPTAAPPGARATNHWTDNTKIANVYFGRHLQCLQGRAAYYPLASKKCVQVRGILPST